MDEILFQNILAAIHGSAPFFLGDPEALSPTRYYKRIQETLEGGGGGSSSRREKRSEEETNAKEEKIHGGEAALDVPVPNPPPTTTSLSSSIPEYTPNPPALLLSLRVIILYRLYSCIIMLDEEFLAKMAPLVDDLHRSFSSPYSPTTCSEQDKKQEEEKKKEEEKEATTRMERYLFPSEEEFVVWKRVVKDALTPVLSSFTPAQSFSCFLARLTLLAVLPRLVYQSFFQSSEERRYQQAHARLVKWERDHPLLLFHPLFSRRRRAFEPSPSRSSSSPSSSLLLSSPPPVTTTTPPRLSSIMEKKGKEEGNLSSPSPDPRSSSLLSTSSSSSSSSSSTMFPKPFFTTPPLFRGHPSSSAPASPPNDTSGNGKRGAVVGAGKGGEGGRGKRLKMRTGEKEEETMAAVAVKKKEKEREKSASPPPPPPDEEGGGRRSSSSRKRGRTRTSTTTPFFLFPHATRTHCSVFSSFPLFSSPEEFHSVRKEWEKIQQELRNAYLALEGRRTPLTSMTTTPNTMAITTTCASSLDDGRSGGGTGDDDEGERRGRTSVYHHREDEKGEEKNRSADDALLTPPSPSPSLRSLTFPRELIHRYHRIMQEWASYLHLREVETIIPFLLLHPPASPTSLPSRRRRGCLALPSSSFMDFSFSSAGGGGGGVSPPSSARAAVGATSFCSSSSEPPPSPSLSGEEKQQQHEQVVGEMMWKEEEGEEEDGSLKSSHETSPARWQYLWRAAAEKGRGVVGMGGAAAARASSITQSMMSMPKRLWSRSTSLLSNRSTSPSRSPSSQSRNNNNNNNRSSDLPLHHAGWEENKREEEVEKKREVQRKGRRDEKGQNQQQQWDMAVIPSLPSTPTFPLSPSLDNTPTATTTAAAIYTIKSKEATSTSATTIPFLNIHAGRVAFRVAHLSLPHVIQVAHENWARTSLVPSSSWSFSSSAAASSPSPPTPLPQWRSSHANSTDVVGGEAKKMEKEENCTYSSFDVLYQMQACRWLRDPLIFRYWLLSCLTEDFPLEGPRQWWESGGEGVDIQSLSSSPTLQQQQDGWSCHDGNRGGSGDLSLLSNTSSTSSSASSRYGEVDDDRGGSLARTSFSSSSMQLLLQQQHEKEQKATVLRRLWWEMVHSVPASPLSPGSDMCPLSERALADCQPHHSSAHPHPTDDHDETNHHSTRREEKKRESGSKYVREVCAPLGLPSFVLLWNVQFVIRPSRNREEEEKEKKRGSGKGRTRNVYPSRSASASSCSFISSSSSSTSSVAVAAGKSVVSVGEEYYGHFDAVMYDETNEKVLGVWVAPDGIFCPSHPTEGREEGGEKEENRKNEVEAKEDMRGGKNGATFPSCWSSFSSPRVEGATSRWIQSKKDIWRYVFLLRGLLQGAEEKKKKKDKKRKGKERRKKKKQEELFHEEERRKRRVERAFAPAGRIMRAYATSSSLPPPPIPCSLNSDKIHEKQNPWSLPTEEGVGEVVHEEVKGGGRKSNTNNTNERKENEEVAVVVEKKEEEEDYEMGFYCEGRVSRYVFDPPPHSSFTSNHAQDLHHHREKVEQQEQEEEKNKMDDGEEEENEFSSLLQGREDQYYCLWMPPPPSSWSSPPLIVSSSGSTSFSSSLSIPVDINPAVTRRNTQIEEHKMIKVHITTMKKTAAGTRTSTGSNQDNHDEGEVGIEAGRISSSSSSFSSPPSHCPSAQEKKVGREKEKEKVIEVEKKKKKEEEENSPPLPPPPPFFSPPSSSQEICSIPLHAWKSAVCVCPPPQVFKLQPQFHASLFPLFSSSSSDAPTGDAVAAACSAGTQNGEQAQREEKRNEEMKKKKESPTAPRALTNTIFSSCSPHEMLSFPTPTTTRASITIPITSIPWTLTPSATACYYRSPHLSSSSPPFRLPSCSSSPPHSYYYYSSSPSFSSASPSPAQGSAGEILREYVERVCRLEGHHPHSPPSPPPPTTTNFSSSKEEEEEGHHPHPPVDVRLLSTFSSSSHLVSPSFSSSSFFSEYQDALLLLHLLLLHQKQQQGKEEKGEVETIGGEEGKTIEGSSTNNVVGAAVVPTTTTPRTGADPPKASVVPFIKKNVVEECFEEVCQYFVPPSSSSYPDPTASSAGAAGPPPLLHHLSNMVQYLHHLMVIAITEEKNKNEKKKMKRKVISVERRGNNGGGGGGRSGKGGGWTHHSFPTRLTPENRKSSEAHHEVGVAPFMAYSWKQGEKEGKKEERMGMVQTWEVERNDTATSAAHSFLVERQFRVLEEELKGQRVPFVEEVQEKEGGGQLISLSFSSSPIMTGKREGKRLKEKIKYWVQKMGGGGEEGRTSATVLGGGRERRSRRRYKGEGRAQRPRAGISSSWSISSSNPTLLMGEHQMPEASHEQRYSPQYHNATRGNKIDGMEAEPTRKRPPSASSSFSCSISSLSPSTTLFRRQGREGKGKGKGKEEEREEETGMERRSVRMGGGARSSMNLFFPSSSPPPPSLVGEDGFLSSPPPPPSSSASSFRIYGRERDGGVGDGYRSWSTATSTTTTTTTPLPLVATSPTVVSRGPDGSILRLPASILTPPVSPAISQAPSSVASPSSSSSSYSLASSFSSSSLDATSFRYSSESISTSFGKKREEWNIQDDEKKKTEKNRKHEEEKKVNEKHPQQEEEEAEEKGVAGKIMKTNKVIMTTRMSEGGPEGHRTRTALRLSSSQGAGAPWFSPSPSSFSSSSIPAGAASPPVGGRVSTSPSRSHAKERVVMEQVEQEALLPLSKKGSNTPNIPTTITTTRTPPPPHHHHIGGSGSYGKNARAGRRIGEGSEELPPLQQQEEEAQGGGDETKRQWDVKSPIQIMSTSTTPRSSGSGGAWGGRRTTTESGMMMRRSARSRGDKNQNRIPPVSTPFQVLAHLVRGGNAVSPLLEQAKRRPPRRQHPLSGWQRNSGGAGNIRWGGQPRVITPSHLRQLMLPLPGGGLPSKNEEEEEPHRRMLFDSPTRSKRISILNHEEDGKEEHEKVFTTSFLSGAPDKSPCGLEKSEWGGGEDRDSTTAATLALPSVGTRNEGGGKEDPSPGVARPLYTTPQQQEQYQEEVEEEEVEEEEVEEEEVGEGLGKSAWF